MTFHQLPSGAARATVSAGALVAIVGGACAFAGCVDWPDQAQGPQTTVVIDNHYSASTNASFAFAADAGGNSYGAAYKGSFNDAFAAFQSDPTKNAASCTGYNYGSGNFNAPDLCWVRHGRSRFGAGINFEQTVANGVGVCGRFMVNDGQEEVDAFASADGDVSVGAVAKGRLGQPRPGRVSPLEPAEAVALWGRRVSFEPRMRERRGAAHGLRLAEGTSGHIPLVSWSLTARFPTGSTSTPFSRSGRTTFRARTANRRLIQGCSSPSANGSSGSCSSGSST